METSPIMEPFFFSSSLFFFPLVVDCGAVCARPWVERLFQGPLPHNALLWAKAERMAALPSFIRVGQRWSPESCQEMSRWTVVPADVWQPVVSSLQRASKWVMEGRKKERRAEEGSWLMQTSFLVKPKHFSCHWSARTHTHSVHWHTFTDRDMKKWIRGASCPVLGQIVKLLNVMSV